jgi:hypothetical protein
MDTRRLSVTDFHVAQGLDNHPQTTDAECAVVDEIFYAWQEKWEPEAGTIPALYAICRRLGINVY